MNRWSTLAVLFFARMSMAFQFQAVAALSPVIAQTYGFGLAEIGLLIGLYLAPGVIVALPGGAVAARFGEKRVVAISMILMLVGSVMIAVAPDLGWLHAGRLLAGAGGVMVNIVMTKMLVDWFEGREIATAMAVFVNSWPVGIALALLVLPFVAGLGGLNLAWLAVIAVITVALVVFLFGFQAAPGSAGQAAQITLKGLPFYTLSLAGLVWALYNSALAMVFSFGPSLLSERGWSLAAAGSATSAFMIAFALAVPFGGIAADRTGRRDTIIILSLLSFAVLMPLVQFASPLGISAIFLAVGVLSALAAGPIMTLPAVVLAPESRTIGMGLFFAIYYVVMMISPRLAGGLADRAGAVSATFMLGAGMAVLAIFALVAFRKATRVAVQSG